MPRELIYKDDAMKAILQTNSMFAYCINNIKPVDAVEVVRCKDCKHYDDDFCMHSQWWDDDGYTTVEESDFCSYGERKDNENRR